jgi:hypothetical protein
LSSDAGKDQAATVSDLIAGIRAGLVPRAVRLFAAQGLLPVSREDLIRVLVLLAAEGDAEIAEAARATLGTFSLDHLLAVMELADLDPLEIDLLARAVPAEALWQRVVRHPRTSNETLRWIAGTAPAATLDVIVTNQTRLLACLEILQDLRANPHVTQDVLRRAREFEEEFLAKASAWAAMEQAETVEAPVAPSIEEALAALAAIGMNVPVISAEPPPLPDPEAAAPPEVTDAFRRLSLLNTFQRIMRALKGTREERLILVRDRNVLIVRAVMMSPKLTELEVEKIAGMRSASDEALRILATQRRWLRRYGTVRALAFNPKTPPGLAIQLVRRLSTKDLSIIVRDRNVSEVVRRVAREIRDRKVGG